MPTEDDAHRPAWKGYGLSRQERAYGESVGLCMETMPQPDKSLTPAFLATR